MISFFKTDRKEIKQKQFAQYIKYVATNTKNKKQFTQKNRTEKSHRKICKQKMTIGQSYCQIIESIVIFKTSSFDFPQKTTEIFRTNQKNLQAKK